MRSWSWRQTDNEYGFSRKSQEWGWSTHSLLSLYPFILLLMPELILIGSVWELLLLAGFCFWCHTNWEVKFSDWKKWSCLQELSLICLKWKLWSNVWAASDLWIVVFGCCDFGWVWWVVVGCLLIVAVQSKHRKLPTVVQWILILFLTECPVLHTWLVMLTGRQVSEGAEAA
jgi:hypothetical protein